MLFAFLSAVCAAVQWRRLAAGTWTQRYGLCCCNIPMHSLCSIVRSVLH